MPELPEIETVKMQLGKVLPGVKITRVEVRGNKIVQGDIKAIEGKKVVGVRRKAKVLLIDIEDEMTIAFHFKMTGQLILVSKNVQDPMSNVQDRIVGGHPTEDFVGKLPGAHTRVIFELEGAEKKASLYFNDQRMFGWVKVGKTSDIEKMDLLEKMGPEPQDISGAQFTDRINRAKRRAIKLVIMDQEIISGVGNIYANDGLWEAKINPQIPAKDLSIARMGSLHKAINLVLAEGIKYGGATAADAKYMNLHGLGGHYQEHFRVYDREGQPCLRNDGGVIQKITLGGRGTYFCPECQKL